MGLSRALDDVLARLEGKPATTIGHDVVAQWAEGALAIMVTIGLLRPAEAAQSVVCIGCELRCFQDVVTRPVRGDENRAFVVCDVPGVQEVMGRIPVPLGRLQQWQCTREILAVFLRERLGLDATPMDSQDETGALALGMAKTSQGRRWIRLESETLSLAMNGQTVPVRELLYAEGERVALDRARIDAVLEAASETAARAYAPNTDRREAGKQATEAMYQDWRDAYGRLRKHHPAKGKRWCAKQIARMPIAQGRDSETIRRRLP